MENKKTYYIAAAPNSPYMKYTTVLMQSLFETNPDKNFCFYIIYNDLKQEERDIVRQYAVENNARVEFVQVDGKRYEGFPTRQRLPIETYFRLEIQELLPEYVERLLYLDCDMIICRDIDELYNLDFEEKYIAACGYSTKLESGGEFNAGMLMMNLKKMREDGITLETYRTLAQQLDGNYYLDQGLLNELFAEKGTKYVWKQKYNFTCPFYRKFRKKLKTEMPDYALDDVTVMHFAGPGLRPWQASISREEFEQLKKKNLLDIFAANGWIIDEIYICFLEKWWDFASRTPYAKELTADMNEKKNEMYAKVLGAVIDSKEYSLGYRLMRLPRKIKHFIRK